MFHIRATATELLAAKAFFDTAVPVSFTYADTPFPSGFTADDRHYTSADGKLRCDFPFTLHEDDAAVE